MLQRHRQQHLDAFVTASCRPATDGQKSEFKSDVFLPPHLSFPSGQTDLPGHSGYHHACSQLFVVLGAYDVTAVVTQGDVGRLGVQRARISGRHRDDAQVPDVSEGSVQVVHCRPIRIQVAERFTTLSDQLNPTSTQY